MYYFYLNFRNYNTHIVMIHKSSCGFCNSGNGAQGSLSNSKGFWAGPFNNILEIESSLQNLQRITKNEFKYSKCSRCFGLNE